MLKVIKGEGYKRYFTIKPIIQASHMKMLDKEMDIACVQY